MKKVADTFIMIRHVWFDFSDTIAGIDHDIHDHIKYNAFAEQTGLSDSPAQRQKYDELYLKHGRSNANVFVREFATASKYWSELLDSRKSEIYSLADPNIPGVLSELAELVPISVFSNVDTEAIMQTLGIDTSLFSHILSSAELRYPKPHVEGYKRLIELSHAPASEILYIGDTEVKDILPAKSIGLQTGMIWGVSKEATYNFTDFEDIIHQLKGKIRT